jgi:hypothetical protein
MWAFYEERWQCIVWTKNGETLFFSIFGVGMRAGFPSVLFFAIDGNLEISFLMLYKNGQNVFRRMRNCQTRRRHAKIRSPSFSGDHRLPPHQLDLDAGEPAYSQ